MIARVYQAINAVAGAMALDGVAKTRLNSRDNYLYRSIDDVQERLAPLLATHRLCVLPRVLEREAADRRDENDRLLILVTLRVAFDLVSVEDGSKHTIEAFGEALDAGDKATAKAMQSAYKYAILQAFCVPSALGEDADGVSYRLKATQPTAEPPEGWTKWCEELRRQLDMGTDEQAVGLVQNQQREALASLRSERPDLYSALGRAIADRREQLRSGIREVNAKPGQKSETGRTARARRRPSESETTRGAHV